MMSGSSSENWRKVSGHRDREAIYMMSMYAKKITAAVAITPSDRRRAHWGAEKILGTRGRRCT